MPVDRSTSELLAFAQTDPFGTSLRALTGEEIDRLRGQSCSAEAWDRIAVAGDFSTRHYWGVHFIGRVVLGPTGDPVGIGGDLTMPAGIYRSVVSDCIVGPQALIHQVGLIHRMVVGSRAVISGVQEIMHETDSPFGNGITVSLGVETGERDLRLFAETPFDRVAAVDHADQAAIRAWNADAVRLRSDMAAGYGYIGDAATVRSVGRIDSSYVGRHARVIGCAALVRSTLLSGRTKDEGVFVGDRVMLEDSHVQWGGRVSGGAYVSRSLVCDAATIDGGARVSHSVVGPVSHVGEGELHSSLLGPFVGHHHQALVVAATWPGGRGNVGYGANVGSNHTGRVPDQEIRVGEGVFFGLGVNIKMPTNLEEAPYTLIATATDTLPQRLGMPFALIMPPVETHPGVPPAFNEILPGWSLYANMYGLVRSAQKFARRNDAHRTVLEHDVFRSEILRPVEAAHDVLSALPDEARYVGDRACPGIGKNVMTREGRDRGIAAYRDALRLAGLRGAFDRIAAGADTTDPWTDAFAQTQFERWITARDPQMVASLYLAAEKDRLDLVRSSRARDMARGRRIIDDYEAVHDAEDVVLARAEERYRAIAERAAALFA